MLETGLETSLTAGIPEETLVALVNDIAGIQIPSVGDQTLIARQVLEAVGFRRLGTIRVTEPEKGRGTYDHPKWYVEDNKGVAYSNANHWLNQLYSSYSYNFYRGHTNLETLLSQVKDCIVSSILLEPIVFSRYGETLVERACSKSGETHINDDSLINHSDTLGLLRHEFCGGHIQWIQVSEKSCVLICLNCHRGTDPFPVSIETFGDLRRHLSYLHS